MDFSDGTSEDIRAVFSHNVRPLLETVELNELASRVDNKRSEVVLHVLLFRGLVALALGCELPMHGLEFGVRLQGCRSFGRCHAGHLGEHV